MLIMRTLDTAGGRGDHSSILTCVRPITDPEEPKAQFDAITMQDVIGREALAINSVCKNAPTAWKLEACLTSKVNKVKICGQDGTEGRCKLLGFFWLQG